jgi:hypothetical protein
MKISSPGRKSRRTHCAPRRVRARTRSWIGKTWPRRSKAWGKSQLHQLKSQVRRVIELLLKLEFSPAADPRRGWVESVGDARSEIELVLDDSPSIKREIGTAITTGLRHAARKAIFALEEHGELDSSTLARIRATTYTEDQILGDWLPPKPQG